MSSKLSGECRRWIDVNHKSLYTRTTCFLLFVSFIIICLTLFILFSISFFTPLCTMWLAPDHNNQLRYNSKITYPLPLLIIRLRMSLRSCCMNIENDTDSHMFFLRRRSYPIPFLYNTMPHIIVVRFVWNMCCCIGCW